MTKFQTITFNTVYDDKSTLKYVQKSSSIYTRRVRIMKIGVTKGYIIGTTYKCDCEVTMFNTHTKKTKVIKRIPFYEVLTNDNIKYLVPKFELDEIRYSYNNSIESIKKLYGHLPYTQERR